jgi:hypothetical protein
MFRAKALRREVFNFFQFWNRFYPTNQECLPRNGQEHNVNPV